MTQSHEAEHHPIRNAFIGAALIILTAVVLINADAGAHRTAKHCASTNPGFTCTFMRMSTGDFTMLTSNFVFTGSFWITLILLSIPVIAFALFIRGLYKKAGLNG